MREVPGDVNTLREGGIGGILDRLPLLISYTDAQGRLQYANRALLLALGKPVDTPVGVPASQVLGTEIYARTQEHVASALRG